MRRTLSLLPIALTVLAAFGCGAATTPTASPPETRPSGQPNEAIDPPRQIQRQVTVMGKNGPETITIMETVNSGTEKLSGYAKDNSSRFPRAASTAEVLKPIPKEKEQ